jgi:peptidoglycan/xylan/chitin deacetylase (PgdA/CDA1 family)
MFTVAMLTIGRPAGAALADAPVDSPMQRAKAAYAVPVLMYHYISTPPADADPSLRTLAVTPEAFKAQLQWLKDNGYRTIAPDELFSGKPIAPKAVLLTFDDGYADAYTNALPILKGFGFQGAFFIITDFVDQNRPGYLTWAEIKQMAADGMTIGAHSRTHQAEAGRTDAWLREEIIGSMDAIEKNTGQRPRFFAYPYGRYDAEAVKIAREAKLTGAFTTINAYWSPTTRHLEVPRLRVRGTTTVAEIASLMNRVQ